VRLHAGRTAYADSGRGTVLRRVLPTLFATDAERNTYEAVEARKQMTTKPIRFSQLSASRQALVRLCQDMNFGQIRDLHVRNSDPVWDPAPTVLSQIKLDTEDTPRPEADLPDFKLSPQIQRLMGGLDQLRDGRIERIDVREGIPRHLFFLASRLAVNAARPTPPCGDPVCNIGGKYCSRTGCPPGGEWIIIQAEAVCKLGAQGATCERFLQPNKGW
jgi:hypothetical protein